MYEMYKKEMNSILFHLITMITVTSGWLESSTVLKVKTMIWFLMEIRLIEILCTRRRAFESLSLILGLGLRKEKKLLHHQVLGSPQEPHSTYLETGKAK